MRRCATESRQSDAATGQRDAAEHDAPHVRRQRAAQQGRTERLT